MAQLASDKYKALRKQVSRMASMANKRIDRLEKNELTDLPAYQSWQEGGSVRFGVKGKTHAQVQAEFWRLKNFLDNKTSTVRGANEFLRQMAVNTGIRYNGLADLKVKSRRFFQLAARIKQYYMNAHQAALALDYQKIWEQINTQIQRGYITIDSVDDPDGLLGQYLQAMNEVVQVENNNEGYRDGTVIWDWIKL